MFDIYSIKELSDIGITIYGTDIKINKSVKIYNPKNLILHDHIRIDDYTIISCGGKVEIFNFVHISSFCLIICKTNIIFKNYSGISSGVKLFGASDDYSGNFMSNPTVPEKYLNATIGDIILEEHALIGANSIILPNVTISHGTSVGAFTLINKTTEEWKMYVGIPARIIRERSKKCLELQHELENT